MLFHIFHAFKVMERVLLVRLMGLVVDRIQMGFLPGRSTTDAVFVVRQVQERYGESGTE